MLSPSPNYGERAFHQLDRRQKPRTKLNRRALIRLRNNLTFPAHIRDLSATTAQIICDSRYGLLIDPSGDGGGLAESAPIELAFALPGSEFRARCRIKYSKFMSNQSRSPAMLFGLKFLGVDFALLQKLESIIESRAD